MNRDLQILYFQYAGRYFFYLNRFTIKGATVNKQRSPPPAAMPTAEYWYKNLNQVRWSSRSFRDVLLAIWIPDLLWFLSAHVNGPASEYYPKPETVETKLRLQTSNHTLNMSKSRKRTPSLEFGGYLDIHIDINPIWGTCFKSGFIPAAKPDHGLPSTGSLTFARETAPLISPANPRTTLNMFLINDTHATEIFARAYGVHARFLMY